MRLRETTEADLPAIQQVHRQAFGQEEEAALTGAILADPTAEPVLSLLAEEDGEVLGHVLFSGARLSDPQSGRRAAILAPLAVAPGAQGKGTGGALVRSGLERLREAGVTLVFVLGDPAYYNRFGFAPATPQGLTAPYSLPKAYAEAWMVRALRDGALGEARGSVICCDALMRPELWRE
ncbi:N-acetyltransferase [Pelagibius sp. CAU 1746]|uniref:GNAT family N-acetyltransferase n=1 Tax=Pelagibius sp. CAU 1746 TaxID=3140370 RepID=UPI00325BABF2